MTPPNDAARPVAWLTDDDRVITDSQKQSALAGGLASASSVANYTNPAYTAADYDALRAEVDELTEAACRTIDDLCATTARAEAAEAKVTKALNLTDTWRRAAHELRYNPAAMPYAADRIEECAKQLDAALNEGGE